MIAQKIETDDITFQRAAGHLEIAVSCDDLNKTRLVDLREEGSFRAIFPQSHNGDFTSVILNTSGGVTGGDRFRVEARADVGAQLTLTTQAAERVYAAIGRDAGMVRTKLHVAAGAQISWLPQETILFDNAFLDRRLDVDLAPDARFLMVEPLIFGRTASGETVRHANLKDRVSIRRDGRAVYLDGITMQGDLAEMLSHTSIANDGCALATIVLCGPDAERALDPVRQLLGPLSGASLQSPDILVVRSVAEDGFALRKAILPILDYLTHSAMPKNWRL